jgi:tetratricopeptide (TPR) repeat protein
VEVVTRQLVMAKIDLAKAKLEIKDYRAAETEANQVLELDPANADARAVKEQVAAVLKELEAAAKEAREAVQAGNLDVAKRALAKVMSIDSQHPVAAELSKQLDSSFRDQVDEARQAMKRSQAAAESAQAGNQHAFEHATASGQEAEELLTHGEFTMATQRFLSARDDFERARKAALEKVAQISVPPPSLRPTTAPPSAHPATPGPQPTAAPTAPPTPIPLPSGPAGGTPGADDVAARRALADYERAIESHDLAQWKRIWPSLSGAQEKQIVASFATAARQDVQIRLLGPVEIKGNEARVKISRGDLVDGKPISPFNQTITLARQGDGWVIKSIGK